MVAVRYNAESDEVSMSNSHLQNDLAERSFGCLRVKACWFALPKRKLIGMIIHDRIPTVKLKIPGTAWKKQDTELLLHSNYSF